MQIAIINGSQKTGESNTGFLVKALRDLVNTRHKIVHHGAGSKQFSPEIYREISASDVIVLAFPLYIDSIPSKMLAMLIELEAYIKKADARNSVVYTIINNGFYEGRQTAISFEIVQNWCLRGGGPIRRRNWTGCR
jgi:multimeric flavodoxin WrbA